MSGAPPAAACGACVGRPFGDFAFAEICDSVVRWVPATRSSLDTLAHSCHSVRTQVAQHRDFAYATYHCWRGCHVRFTKNLDAGRDVSLAAMLRCSEKLSGLEILRINNSSVRTDKLATVVSKCTSLRTLELTHIEITYMAQAEVGGRLLAAITRLRQLQALTLTHCACAFSFFPNLRKCDSIKKLDLTGTNVDDRGVSAIACIPRLEILILAKCKHVTNFAPLAGCKTLTELDVSSTAVDDEEIAAIAQLPCLERLFLDDSKSVTHFHPLGACTTLKELDLAWTSVDDSAIAEISRLPRLDRLDMAACTKVTNFASLVHCTSLKDLDVGWSGVDDEWIAAIAHLPCLSRLRLFLCKAITNFAPLAATESLTELDLTATNVDNSGIAAIARLPRLALLFLCDCKRVSDFTPLNSMVGYRSRFFTSRSVWKRPSSLLCIGGRLCSFARRVFFANEILGGSCCHAGCAEGVCMR